MRSQSVDAADNVGESASEMAVPEQFSLESGGRKVKKSGWTPNHFCACLVADQGFHFCLEDGQVLVAPGNQCGILAGQHQHGRTLATGARVQRPPMANELLRRLLLLNSNFVGGRRNSLECNGDAQMNAPGAGDIFFGIFLKLLGWWFAPFPFPAILASFCANLFSSRFKLAFSSSLRTPSGSQMNSGWPAGIASGDYIGKGKERKGNRMVE
jgi:hypothetical protein